MVKQTNGINLIDSQDLRSRARQYATAKVHVFSDSVLCLGRMGDDPNQSWKSKIKCLSETNFFSELNRIDGKPMEFEWMILPALKTAAILKEIQNKIGESQCDPVDFKDMIIFMSMFNDIEWEARGNEEICENNSKSVAEYARQFLRGHLSFLGLSPRKSGAELTMAYQVDIGRKQWRKCC